MLQHRVTPKRQSLSLSPPAWKAQLRQRCLQRLKQSRGQLLARLRRPGASVAREAKRLVNASVSVDDLLLLGRLDEREYVDILHGLEDALRDEQQQEQEMARQAQALEDAELEALLAGMELGDAQEDEGAVLCPICKSGYLHEREGQARPFVGCGCGFTFHVKLEDFQEKIVTAFMKHRDACAADPTFVKMPPQDDADVLGIKCAHCGCDHVLP